MSLVKSYSVGDGDMFHVKHDSDNFTIIDCCLSDENKEDITDELKQESKEKGIVRFISTHPDDDHIGGLKHLDSKMKFANFYCVKNEATKSDETEDFTKYCELRDSEEKSFYLKEGCTRKWINKDGDDDSGNYRDHSGINVLWPRLDNEYFKDALDKAKDGDSPNNISPIVKYNENDSAILWMGDLENDFMENIIDEVSFPKINVLFAPHHGRKSGRVPDEWIEEMDPDIIVMGEAPSKNLDYSGYDGHNKITQNSAGDIIFECIGNKIHIFVSNENYTVDFLDDEGEEDQYDCYYIGTLTA
ncbi:MBL fold metallo-hydrolase [candidate division WOR-3 bacterium]|nr:MBL fold metallo-hydrolase [candidate division WOR-3 bacterium]